MNSLRGTPEYQPRPRIILPSANIDTAVGTADKILDFFLRRKRVLAKYTKEEKQKAIDLYIRYCKQATKVIKELGYPNERHTLVSWYRGYEEKGEVKDDGREEKRLSHVHSEDQVHTAVSFYIEHGKSLSKTVEYLGYPHRTRTLKVWVEKLSSEILFLYFHEKPPNWIFSPTRRSQVTLLSPLFVFYLFLLRRNLQRKTLKTRP